MNLLAEAGQMQTNPFVILTFIVAPAILTNASALMVLSTSNRFARAVDRARDLSRQIEVARKDNDHLLLDRLDNELMITEKRAVLLLRAIRSFYMSLGGFASGALVALIGAGLARVKMTDLNMFFGFLAIAVVFLAVAGLVAGSMYLFYEARLTVGIIQDRIQRLSRNRL